MRYVSDSLASGYPSTRVPPFATLQGKASEKEAVAANRQTPVFMAHGLNDDVVALQFGLQTRSLLQQLGYRLQWHDYAMGHSVCMEEISDISDWLGSVLAQD